MRLHTVDIVIIAAYLVGITLFGLRFRKKQRTLRDYFLADRNIPWWAIGLSIVAAETSTLTIIGTPGIAYGGNFGFLQVIFGYLLGRVIISLILIPQYFRGEMFTAYQLIDRRFGAALHRLTLLADARSGRGRARLGNLYCSEHCAKQHAWTCK